MHSPNWTQSVGQGAGVEAALEHLPDNCLHNCALFLFIELPAELVPKGFCCTLQLRGRPASELQAFIINEDV